MRPSIQNRALSVSALLGMLAFVWVAGLSGQARKSQWDGVFTAEQADRGRAVYTQFCENCHGAELEGEGHAPPLIGESFAADWHERTLFELFDKIKTTMPSTSPGRLSAAETADVMAFMLRSGSYPAGATELPQSDAALKAIRLLAARP